MAEKIVVIANPQSQNGALGRRVPELRAACAELLGAHALELTRAPGDAARLARAAIEGGAGVVVAVGGDGTLHETLAGFFAPDAPRPVGEAALGFVPFGTGGDFRKTAGIPVDLRLALAAIAAGRERRIDAGWLEHQVRPGGPRAARPFINITSFGISGEVDRIVNSSSKALGGAASFLVASLRAGLLYRNRDVELSLDGGAAERRRINLVAVANGRWFGGGMKVAPAALLDDGLFDVVDLGDWRRRDLLLHGTRIYSGTHVDLPGVSVRRARVVEARPLLGGDEIRIDSDGETPGCLPVRISLLPGAIRLRG